MLYRMYLAYMWWKFENLKSNHFSKIIRKNQSQISRDNFEKNIILFEIQFSVFMIKYVLSQVLNFCVHMKEYVSPQALNFVFIW